MTAGNDSPRVVVVVLNWNGCTDTFACLASLELMDRSVFRVIVVDNGSTDDSVTAIRARAWACPVEVLENGANLGFAGGNNVGIRRALELGADHVLLLNNDTEVAPDLMEELLLASRTQPNVAVMGPWIYYCDRPSAIWFAGAEWSGDDLSFRWPYQGCTNECSDLTPHETAYVCGAAMMFRRDALERVGLLDERFFLVYEESDWCFRARRLGYRCLMIPQAKVWHKIGASFGSEQSPLRAYFSTRNQLLFAAIHLGRKERIALLTRAVVRLTPRVSFGALGPSPWRRVWWGLTDWVTEIRRRATDPVQRAARRGLYDYLRGKFGDCPQVVRECNRVWVRP